MLGLFISLDIFVTINLIFPFITVLQLYFMGFFFFLITKLGYDWELRERGKMKIVLELLYLQTLKGKIFLDLINFWYTSCISF